MSRFLFVACALAAATPAAASCFPGTPLDIVRCIDATVDHLLGLHASHGTTSPPDWSGSSEGAWVPTGHNILLPEAGTWLVHYSADCFRHGGERGDQAFFMLRLDGAIHEKRGLAGRYLTTDQSHGVCSATRLVTTGGPGVIDVAVLDVADADQSLYDAELGYVRID